MKMQFKDIIAKVYDSPWGKASISVLICILWYWIRKKIILSEGALVLTNIGTFIFLLIGLHQIIKERKVPLARMFLILAFGFITNRLYDVSTFYNLFHVNLIDVCLALGIGSVIVLIIPMFIKVVGKIVSAIEDIVRYCIEYSKQKRHQEEQKKKSVLVDKKRKREALVSILAPQKEEEIVYQPDEEKEIDVEVEQVTHKIHADMKEINEGKEKEEAIEKNKKREEKKDRWTFVVIFLLIVSIPVFLIVSYLDKELFLKFESLELIDLINIVTLSIVVFICVMLVCAMAIGIIIKLVNTLVDMIRNRDNKNYYFIYVGVFLLISAYISKEYDYTVDDVANAIAKGDIFSFPLIMIIMLPVFLIFIDSIWKYFQKEKELKDEIYQLVYSIAVDIVITLLKYIRFVTADFLSSIADIVEEDLYDKERKNVEIHENVDGNDTENTSEEIGEKKEREISDDCKE